MDLRRKLARRLFARVYGAYVSRRVTRPSEARFLGYHLLTEPDVFHPVYFLSSRVLADSLRGFPLAGKRFLDMGTGAGPVAVVAAGSGATVTACDVNPHAVALAARNLKRNRLPGEVLESDLFSALVGRRFDIICFNIPFYPRPAQSPLDRAFFAGPELQTVRAFAHDCREHLADGGLVRIVFSEDCGRGRVLSLFADAGFSVAEERFDHRLLDCFHTVSFRLPRCA
jgi:release factor glutamine methyltransferase